MTEESLLPGALPPVEKKIRKSQKDWGRKCGGCREPHYHGRGLSHPFRGKQICRRCLVKFAWDIVKEEMKRYMDSLKAAKVGLGETTDDNRFLR